MKAQIKSQRRGAALEKDVEAAIAILSRNGIASAFKVSPPARIFGGRVVFTRNPFLDFTGAIHGTGRALVIECKVTRDPVLRLNAQVSRSQIEAIMQWTVACALVLLVWRQELTHGWAHHVITGQRLLSIYRHRKRIIPEDCLSDYHNEATFVPVSQELADMIGFHIRYAERNKSVATPSGVA